MMSQKLIRSLHNVSYCFQYLLDGIAILCFLDTLQKWREGNIVPQDWQWFYNLNFSVAEQSLVILFHLICVKLSWSHKSVVILANSKRFPSHLFESWLATEVCRYLEQNRNKLFYFIYLNLGCSQKKHYVEKYKKVIQLHLFRAYVGHRSMQRMWAV